MPRELERKSIEELKEDIRQEEYSPETVKIVEEQARDIVPGREHLEYENVIYIAVMPDDSGSIAGQNSLERDNTQDVIEGHNNIVEALNAYQQKRIILFKTQYLKSDTALNNWVPLDKVVQMTRNNFTPQGGTPLYDKTLSLLTSVIYEKTEASKRGQRARWGILVITDGDDTESQNPASKVKLILDDMRKKGELLPSCEPDNEHAGSIALLGVEDRESDDPKSGAYFEKVAQSMGIGWVLHVDRADPRAMRRAFNTFSTKFSSAAR